MSPFHSVLARVRPAIICAALAASAWAEEPYLQTGDTPFVADALNKSRDGARELKRSEKDLYNVEVWDTRTGKLLSAIKGLAGVVNAANISADGKWVVTGERNGSVALWDAETGKQIFLMEGHKDQAHDARFSQDGSLIASAARDGTARTWDTKTGKPVAVHKQHGGSFVDTVSFTPDGRWVLSAGNGWLDVWDARTGKEQWSKQIGAEDGGAFSTAARFGPDGKSIYVMDDDSKPSETLAIELPAP
jgi:WD40 repeat protein